MAEPSKGQYAAARERKDGAGLAAIDARHDALMSRCASVATTTAYPQPDQDPLMARLDSMVARAEKR
jgi:hypothetical protein